MNTIHFDIVGGAAGDMVLASLIELGCPLSYLEKELKKLRFPFTLQRRRINLGHFKGTKLIIGGSKKKLTYQGVIKALNQSRLTKEVKEQAKAAYRDIFLVEKRIHGVRGNNMAFHHLGEIDAILEIVGFYLALDYLKAEDIFVGAFPLSNPAPATLNLLKGKHVTIVDFGYESITPTAAVLLKSAQQEGGVFSFKKYGLGAGTYHERDYLIAYLSVSSPYDKDTVIKIETNIDDMNPQIFETVFDALYTAGAREVYLEQVIMKKSRPGFVLNVLCTKDNFEKIKEVIGEQTTTFGLRFQEFHRAKLKSSIISKNTPFGKINYRVSQGPVTKSTPEYEDCKKAAQRYKISLREVYQRLTSKKV